MNIIQKPSPNFAVGRGTFKPEVIVIHIMEGTIVGTDAWFQNPASAVSAHYGVGRSGEVHQYVRNQDTAWHAGRVLSPTFSLYKPGVDPNKYTFGIEHEGISTSVWTQEQKTASAALIKQICTEWSIPIDRDHIIGHYQVFAGKPNCPAVNKDVINELISLASAGNPQQLKEAIDLVEKGLNKMKAIQG